MAIISVLIPVFNEDISGLAKDLSKSVSKAQADIEIIFSDDASTNKKQSQKNADLLAELPGFNYIIQKHNLGYCENRNYLANQAGSDYLLFLDADVRLLKDDFLNHWLEQIPSNIFLCGGNVYQSKTPTDIKKILKWKHGKKREEAVFTIRNLNPHLKFWASNFMVMKSLFLQVPFDRRSKNYGYNDTVYAYLLMKQNIPVKHIDNPVLNTGLIENREFLKRTEEAINNLIFFESQAYIEKDFKKFISLLSVENKLKKFGLIKVVRIILSKFEMKLRRNLMSEWPNLRYLDLLKLHLLLQSREK